MVTGEKDVAEDSASLPERSSKVALLADALTAAFPCYLIWLAAAAAFVYVKVGILSYMTVGRALGRIESVELTKLDPSRSYLFSFWERISFFRADLLWAFVLLPMLGFALLFWMPRRLRVFCVVVLSFAVILFLYLQMHGFWMVGQFQSWKDWYDAIRWGVGHPGDAGTYTGSGMAVKLGTCLAVLSSLGILFARKWNLSRRWSVIARAAAWTCYGVVVCSTALCWFSPITSTPFHHSMLAIIGRAFFRFTDFDVLRYDSLGREEVLAKWREVTKSPERKANPEYFGVAKDCDVVLFVMETAPARCLDIAGELDGMPNLKRLRERAWIAPQHFTTFPYTSCALFSLLTSWYPTDVRYLTSFKEPPSTPGLMRSLGSSGYKTAVYMPSAAFSEDDALHYSVGVTDIVRAQDTEEPPTDGILWQKTAFLDTSALELLKKDITGWIRDNQRYAVLYLPQIGHAPWPDVNPAEGKNLDCVSRGRAVIELQDKWLGDLVATLEKSGRLDRTIILVTGDHGIRTGMEDPDFEPGTIGPYTFQVPFLLFAPAALKETVTITWPTSHIDACPSILDLMGEREHRDSELGSPLWDQRIADRTIFFWATLYLGADGFHKPGKFCMWQHMSDTVYSSSKFSFQDVKPLDRQSAERKDIVATLSDGMALQHRITRLMSKTK
jgi:membrane-anchored protein YejM (alkaline phosphatase superfamily)